MTEVKLLKQERFYSWHLVIVVIETVHVGRWL